MGEQDRTLATQGLEAISEDRAFAIVKLPTASAIIGLYGCPRRYCARLGEGVETRRRSCGCALADLFIHFYDLAVRANNSANARYEVYYSRRLAWHLRSTP